MVKKYFEKIFNKKSEKIKKIYQTAKDRTPWHFYLNFRKCPALSIAGWHWGWYR